MRVLGIETSCDDTGVALFDDSAGGLLVHRLASQVRRHQPYGGIVPELAARDHIRAALPLVRAMIDESGGTAADIDGVAYTAGPGLAGALLVGAALGRSLAWAWQVPAIGVHHMEAHLLAPLLEPDPPTFPFLALLVSGGHTLLVDVAAVGEYRVLGQSLDDAVGEAFDKTAKFLGLEFPGGPAIERVAQHGAADRFTLPRPMTGRPGLDFSFSGLKTAVVTAASGVTLDTRTVADMAAAFQAAVVDTLEIKCRRALRATARPALVVAGGVGANRALRTRLRELGTELGVRVSYPRPEFCTDNGAMVAYAGWVRLNGGQHSEPAGFDIHPRWSLADLPALRASGRAPPGRDPGPVA